MNRSARLQAVFWDNDGILVDTEELFYHATRTVLAAAGFAISTEEFTDCSLRQGRSVFDLLRETFDEAAIERLRTERNARYAARLAAGIPALDGVESVLEALHGRVTMGVVTSTSPEHFELIHRGTGLARYFDFVLTNVDYQRTKPDPAPYLAALARAGCDPAQCIAIEDSERGLVAARAAGLRCIVVPRGLTRGGEFGAAYRVLDDVRDIVAVVTPLMD
jgi:HAD superfamily hydrolase (TIGR01509 family)